MLVEAITAATTAARELLFFEFFLPHFAIHELCERASEFARDLKLNVHQDPCQLEEAQEFIADATVNRIERYEIGLCDVIKEMLEGFL